MKREILVRQHGGVGAALLVKAGPFVFTSGCDGHRDLRTGQIVPGFAGSVEMQCENSYGKVLDLLREIDLGPEAVVRLDHFTSSQDWLTQRKSIRRCVFGRPGEPAPLASTGVAAKMVGINMLTTAAMAAAAPGLKKIVVSGPQHGMDTIAGAVLADPFLFVSGARGTVNPRTRIASAEETEEAFAAQVRVCYEVIRDILNQCGAGPRQILRLDCYLRDVSRADEERAVRRDVLGDVPCAVTAVGVPMGARGEVEITALALAPGRPDKAVYRQSNGGAVAAVRAAGWVLISECLGGIGCELAGKTEDQFRAAFSTLNRRLVESGSRTEQVVRLDIYLRDVYQMHLLDRVLRETFGAEVPAVLATGADLPGISEISLNAIALSDTDDKAKTL
jgi:enamine deaminase RidA (YjgF/YER057c/UK114 family)